MHKHEEIVDCTDADTSVKLSPLGANEAKSLALLVRQDTAYVPAVIRREEEPLEPRSGAIIALVADSLNNGNKSEEDQVSATHMIKCSRQRSKSTQPPTCYSSDLGSYLQVENFA